MAVNELHGIGTFFDERFDDATQLPIAAAAKLGHVSVDPDTDQVTGKLAALHFYQLALPSVQPRPGIDFDKAAAARGDELFSGKPIATAATMSRYGRNQVGISIQPMN